ncbi:MAG: glycoside hydrolase 43 family protein [Prevotellaceae bacterium]|nr:glycoside hydrolase 43 family protein [Prevotellaceae bacterium]
MIKKLFSLSISLFSALWINAQAPTSWTADNGNGTFTNPLLYDEFSDPDIIRVGDDYYLAGTTMHSVPGLVILHSKDLVNWENISYCFDRFDFKDDAFSLKNGKEVYGQGIWAPCIRYANGQFYLYSNINGKGLQCYTSKDIHGPWVHHNMQGKIYDLSVLFDDDGKIYAIHGYGEVHCTELKPDMSGPIESTDKVIIPEGSAVGEGHHMYKMNGMYYLISTDYKPNGRTICSRSKSIWGPYEQCVITADETFGYHAVGLTDWKGRIVPDGSKFKIGAEDKDATACTNIHQGGIVQTQKGDWYALLMMDFHSVGRTVTLAPITWKDGWPMIGLEGNLGRAPRTWLKPDIPGTENIKPYAAYQRNENFNGKTLGRVWQWNHNPDDKKWSIKGGKLQLKALPADQLMWARNSLTQRVVGPRSIYTVELSTSKMKDGDVAGIGNINVPCSWLGVVKEGTKMKLRCFEQLSNDTIDYDAVNIIGGNGKMNKLYLRMVGDWDNNIMHYAVSGDGVNFQQVGHKMKLSYQLVTFQGSRVSLFAFNKNKVEGGIAEFDNFTCQELDADRSNNIPLGKEIRIINLATGKPMHAQPHGLLYDTSEKDNSMQTKFKVIDKGNGKVILQCADGRYVFTSGMGLPGDVRLTKDESKAEVFMWQDYLNKEFMLMSMRTHTYIGKSPTTGSPYSMDYKGADPARRNGAVFRWE